jgi:hypothetical protein
VLRKEYRRVAPRGNHPPAHDNQEGPDFSPPEGDFENWHGYYWARRTEEGDYAIRSVPSTLGEHSMPGGVFPKESFEQHYEKVNP